MHVYTKYVGPRTQPYGKTGSMNMILAKEKNYITYKESNKQKKPALFVEFTPHKFKDHANACIKLFKAAKAKKLDKAAAVKLREAWVKGKEK